jgi:hypothetical protein
VQHPVPDIGPHVVPRIVLHEAGCGAGPRLFGENLTRAAFPAKPAHRQQCRLRRGQAGSSSRIENYLGFPTGLSGQELANSAIAQSEKFSAKIMVARTVEGLNCDERPYRIALDDGQQIAARSSVLATGAAYNQLTISAARFRPPRLRQRSSEPPAHKGRSLPPCSLTMYSAYQSGQFSSRCPPVRFSCSPCAASVRRSAAARSADEAKVVAPVSTRPGAR